MAAMEWNLAGMPSILDLKLELHILFSPAAGAAWEEEMRTGNSGEALIPRFVGSGKSFAVGEGGESI
jgi:hypothetical protein